MAPEARLQARQQQAPSASAPSQTITETSQPPSQEQTPRVLRLRGARNPAARSVQWADDVVDNEGLGRKSSKGL
jgi:protein phosphatase 1 regulatory subunit 11